MSCVHAQKSCYSAVHPAESIEGAQITSRVQDGLVPSAELNPIKI